MSVKATTAALQAKWLTLTGVTSAPTEMPASLNTAALPTALTFPGPADWRLQTATLKRQQRDYLVRVYVAPVAQGQGVDEGFQDTLTLLQTLGEAALDWSSWRSTYFEQIDDITDNGHEILMFADIAYHGFTLTLSIIEKE